MRRGWVIGGIVLLVIGILLALVGIVVQGTATSVAIPAGSADVLSPSSIGGSTFSASWSGASAGTQVYLITGTPTCSNPSGVVANGTGASGSLSATLTSGTSYQLYACNAGSGEAINVSWTAMGLSILMVIGVVLVLVGVVVAILGMRRPTKAAPAEPAVEEPMADLPAEPPAT